MPNNNVRVEMEWETRKKKIRESVNKLQIHYIFPYAYIY